jgi:hypothetical protein
MGTAMTVGTSIPFSNHYIYIYIYTYICVYIYIHTRGVFKKRMNFLNSAPTSIESALRLLSAPGVRFWKQTAICPVSLWVLVVELHPLNWAYKQAVRRISDKVTMKELEEQRVCEILLQTWWNFYRDITHSVYVQWQGFCNYSQETSGPLKAGNLLSRDLIEFTQHTNGTRC